MRRQKVLAHNDFNDYVEAMVEDIMLDPEEYGWDKEDSKEYITEALFNDQEWYDDFQYDLRVLIGELFKKKFPNGCVKIVGSNLDWRHRSGYMYLKILDIYMQGDSDPELEAIGNTVINAITPDCDYTLRCYNEDKGLRFVVSSHDCPTGSVIILKPCAVSTYYRHNEE